MRLFLVLSAIVILLGGCAKIEESSLPQPVAQKFWSAMVEGDIKEAKSLTVRGRIEEPFLDVELKKAEIEGARVVNGRAFVPTTLKFVVPVESVKISECNASFDTELLKIEGRWLVDDVVTMENYDKALQSAVASCSSKLLEDALKRGLQSFDEVKKELEKSFFGISKEFEKSFKMLQKELQESLEKMQKELEKEPSKLPEPSEGDKI